MYEISVLRLQLLVLISILSCQTISSYSKVYNTKPSANVMLDYQPFERNSNTLLMAPSKLKTNVGSVKGQHHTGKPGTTLVLDRRLLREELDAVQSALVNNDVSAEMITLESNKDVTKAEAPNLYDITDLASSKTTKTKETVKRDISFSPVELDTKRSTGRLKRTASSSVFNINCADSSDTFGPKDLSSNKLSYPKPQILSNKKYRNYFEKLNRGHNMKLSKKCNDNYKNGKAANVPLTAKGNNICQGDHSSASSQPKPQLSRASLSSATAGLLSEQKERDGQSLGFIAVAPVQNERNLINDKTEDFIDDNPPAIISYNKRQIHTPDYFDPVASQNENILQEEQENPNPQSKPVSNQANNAYSTRRDDQWGLGNINQHYIDFKNFYFDAPKTEESENVPKPHNSSFTDDYYDIHNNAFSPSPKYDATIQREQKQLKDDDYDTKYDYFNDDDYPDDQNDITSSEDTNSLESQEKNPQDETPENKRNQEASAKPTNSLVDPFGLKSTSAVVGLHPPLMMAASGNRILSPLQLMSSQQFPVFERFGDFMRIG